tara:strand:- start:73 stop:417 length:345 start_codon:yes stop_codon:yes gene_type:complete
VVERCAVGRGGRKERRRRGEIGREIITSIEERRVTIALCEASVRPPSASVDVHTTWLAIGTTATSSTTASMITTSAPLPRTPRTTQMAPMHGSPMAQIAKRIWTRGRGQRSARG